ncbi:crotonase/enoyl-CoA hydratase family protein [Azohydromonas lata]|uniref:Crotonase/enoyl-CoA hydratase family protein n=1 Tax=Azohydromonas lata TaxID=45677 RepID=A0ABU5IB93_9BURK|nr:crotonase/enoyl-CoA hydratase family protein [Azohydromonas lata]MDZ5456114.1 crotonase/enoyl-CoA hydratase family protein [Azohydromonas lata]
MHPDFTPAAGLLADLDLLHVETCGPVLHVRLMRPAKRNAISDPLIQQLHTVFINLPQATRAVVVSGEGEHFCAGLDLSELVERDIGAGVQHSRMWHAAFDAVQFGRVPVVAALHGAVVGGGLELASSCHIRVADDSAYFGLPEGQRGIFVGGGGSVRIPRLIGVSRMTDLMLTGRVYDADEAQAVGLVQYRVAEGQALDKAVELARRIATNAPMSNYAVMHALPRIADQSQSEGQFTESLMAAVAESTPDAQERLRAFLEKRAGKVLKG